MLVLCIGIICINQIRTIDMTALLYDSEEILGWSGGAKVLGKLSVPGRPTHFG